MNWRIGLGVAIVMMAFIYSLDAQYVVSGIAAISTLLYLWLQFRPASMKFFNHPIPAREDEGNDWLVIECKKNEPVQIYIGLHLRWPRNFKIIDIRFVEKHWFLDWLWLVHDVPDNSLKVMKVEDQHYSILHEEDHELSKHEENKAGGIQASYKETYECPYNGWMWYAVQVQSERSQFAYLSFQLRRGNKVQGIVRRSVCFRLNE